MALLSDLFRGEPRLDACLTNDSAHLTEGTVGAHVAKVQLGLLVVDALGVEPDERRAQRYGPTTAAAVLSFKTKRQIINRSYQVKPDNIVGKMTIAALDQELLRKQKPAKPSDQVYCACDPRVKAATRSGVARSSSFGIVTQSAVPAGRGQVVGGPGGASPAAVARTRAPGGIAAVLRARAALGRLISFNRHPVLPVPADLGREWDVLWDNFGLPKFPLTDPLVANAQVTDLVRYLTIVDSVLAGMATSLAQAATLFREPKAPSYPDAGAFTLGGLRHPKDPPGEPDGVYFNPRYLADVDGVVMGPRKQTEIVIHECGHVVNNQTIQDPFPQLLSSAYGYSNYVLHCAFNQTGPFNDTE